MGLIYFIASTKVGLASSDMEVPLTYKYIHGIPDIATYLSPLTLGLTSKKSLTGAFLASIYLLSLFIFIYIIGQIIENFNYSIPIIIW